MCGHWFALSARSKQKQGIKVCKVTAVQCYQCFSLRLLLFLACRANWLMELYGSVVNSGGTAVKRPKSFWGYPYSFILLRGTHIWRYGTSRPFLGRSKSLRNWLQPSQRRYEINCKWSSLWKWIPKIARPTLNRSDVFVSRLVSVLWGTLINGTINSNFFLM